MEGHPAVPDGNDLQRTRDIVGEMGKLIKENIAEACTDNKTQREVENEILEYFSLQADPAGLLLDADKHIGCDEPQRIHETIPSKLEWTDFDDGRIDIRIR